MVGGTDRRTVAERIDRSYDLLSNAYRRQILYTLRDGEDDTATTGELADAVLTAGLADARDRTLASLIHTHLPKLDDHGVVEYDRDDGVVSRADSVSRIEPFLEVTARRETGAEHRSFADGTPREAP